MATQPLLGFKGLKTSGNELLYPPGSLLQADNCCMPSKDILAVRRGQPRDYANTFGASALYHARNLVEYLTKLVVHYGTGDGTALAISTPKGAWTTLAGTWEAADPTVMRMKFAQLARNLYWASSSGLGVLDGIETASAARAAGVAAPGEFYVTQSDTFFSGNPNAAGTWLPVNSAIGYRAVVGRKDANGNIKLSAPNGRLVVTNPADVTVAIGSLARAGGTTVTATVAAGHNFRTGDILALSPGEANFAAGNYTVTGITSTTVTYSNAGANVVSTLQQTLSSGTKNVSLLVTLPDGVGIVAGDFLQLYRTEPTAAATTDPGDECLLAYERTLTATDISTRVVTIVDQTPASVGANGAPLYTNANTGKGEAFANLKPPLCGDVCIFDGRLWGTNTQGPHELTLRLIGTGSPNGLQAGDLLALNDVVYSVNGFLVEQFTPTRNISLSNAILAQSVDITASGTNGIASMVARCIGNDATGSTALLLQRRELTAGAFYAASSRATAWQDPLPTITAVTEASTTRTSNVVTVTTATAHGLSTGASIMLAFGSGTSEDANFPAGLKTPITVTGGTTFTYAETGSNATMTGTYYVYAATYGSKRFEQPLRFSEQGQPEAWPLVNYPGGLPDGADVLRIAALRGVLYVFLQRGDVYTVSGTYPYSVQKFDGTATLLAPDSLVEHNGRLYGLTTQGICAISEAGVQVMSLDIEDALRAAMISPTAMASTFGVSYESDRQYQLWLGNTSTARICNEGYVWQSDQQCFGGRWVASGTNGRTCGLVLKNATEGDLLCMGDGATNALRYESKGYDADDYWEDVLTIGNGTNIECVSNGVFSATSGTPFSGVEVGDAVYWNEDPTQAGHVVSVDATTLVTDTAIGSPSDTAYMTLLKGIYPLTLEWLAASAGSPAVEKQWREAHIHGDEFYVDTLTATFDTERTQDTPATDRDMAVAVDKYSFAGTTRDLFTLRLGIVQECQRAAMLRTELDFGYFAGQRFRLYGYSLTAEGQSERTGHKSGVP